MDKEYELFKQAENNISKLKDKESIESDDHLLLINILLSDMDFFKSKMSGINNFAKYEILLKFMTDSKIYTCSTKAFYHKDVKKLLFKNGIFTNSICGYIYLIIYLTISFILMMGLTSFIHEPIIPIQILVWFLTFILLLIISPFEKIDFYTVSESK